jgi:PDZ domain-containing secreted protein
MLPFCQQTILVTSILPSSKAKGIIHVGAMIHVVDGQEVHKTSGFIDIMKKKGRRKS